MLYNLNIYFFKLFETKKLKRSLFWKLHKYKLYLFYQNLKLFNNIKSVFLNVNMLSSFDSLQKFTF